MKLGWMYVWLRMLLNHMAVELEYVESERRKAVQRFLRGLKSKEKTEVEHE